MTQEQRIIYSPGGDMIDGAVGEWGRVWTMSTLDQWCGNIVAPTGGVASICAKQLSTTCMAREAVHCSRYKVGVLYAVTWDSAKKNGSREC